MTTYTGMLVIHDREGNILIGIHDKNKQCPGSGIRVDLPEVTSKPGLTENIQGRCTTCNHGVRVVAISEK